jgi:hypothetical protein
MKGIISQHMRYSGCALVLYSVSLMLSHKNKDKFHREEYLKETIAHTIVCVCNVYYVIKMIVKSKLACC